MSHQLLRLKSKIVNVPHMIDSSSFETIIDYVNKRCSESVDTSPETLFDSGPKQLTYNADIQTGVIEITGPLTYKPTMFAALCGGTSYEGLKEDFSAMVDAGAKTVALIIDSPGGEAYSVFDTANYIRKMADDNGVKILAYVDGLSASAGYALTAIADEVITNTQSELGSIGVVVRLMNDSKALEKEGYERTYVFAGESKTPFADDGSFRKDFISDIQSKVDTLYTEFTEFVARHRNMSVETVKSTQARTFLAKEAIELGLADSSMTVDQFYNYLADSAQRPEGNTVLKNKLFNMNKTNEETPDMTHLAQLQSLQSELEAAKTQLAEFTSVKESLTTLQAAFAEKQAELSTALEQVKELNSYKEQVKTQSRQDKLKAVGQDETVAKALASLDDTSFEAALAGFTASFEKQKQVMQSSGMMEELGGEGAEPEASQQNDSAKDRTEAALKQKLGLK